MITINQPEYTYLKVVPNNSLKNNNTYQIAQAINSTYKNFLSRVKITRSDIYTVFNMDFIIPKEIQIDIVGKVTYLISLEKDKVEFYFIVPKKNKSIIKEAISRCWSSLTIFEIDKLPISFSDNAVYKHLDYKKEDALSLQLDRRNNTLLESNLNITNMLDKGEKVTIIYNFIPTNQSCWNNDYKKSIKKYKDGELVDKSTGSAVYIFKLLVDFIQSSIDSIIKVFGCEPKQVVKNSRLISESTDKKGDGQIIDTQILLISDSKEKLQSYNISRSAYNTYKCIDDDNQLIYKNQQKNFNLTDRVIKGASVLKVGAKESTNFLSLPGRELLDQYRFIEKIQTAETQVPEELRTGVMSLGYNTCKGIKNKAYLSNDEHYKNLTTVLIGPTRAGKSTLIANLIKDGLDNNECCVVFDFCGNCELSNEVIRLFPKDKILEVNCNDFDTMQGLGYNEAKITSDSFKNYANAKIKASQLKALIDSINIEDKTLTSKMERYLTSAALVAFISDGSINDVFKILQHYKYRSDFIRRIPEEQKENFKEYVEYLNELNEEDKKGNVTTKYYLITGIIDRLNKLKDNPYIELMLKKDCKNNFNLVEEFQKSQLICLKMPEDMFSTDSERDTYCTYWITKIWFALQIRKSTITDRKKVNLIIDELSQVNHTEEFMTSKLSRFAKFGLKPIISCHYLNQIKTIREELRSANTSYVLIAGCDKYNYNELKEELQPFTVEDLLNLKRYHALNLIKYSEGYARFITELPKPI